MNIHGMIFFFNFENGEEVVAPKDRLKKFNEKVKQYQITFFQRRLFKDVGQYHQVTK